MIWRSVFAWARKPSAMALKVSSTNRMLDSQSSSEYRISAADQRMLQGFSAPPPQGTANWYSM